MVRTRGGKVWTGCRCVGVQQYKLCGGVLVWHSGDCGSVSVWHSGDHMGVYQYGTVEIV